MNRAVNIAPAHSQFGGSVASRILGCPASVGLIAKLPANLRKPSSAYADRGSALHVVMSRLIEGECALDDLAGTTIDDYTITHDDVEDALRPAYAYVDALLTPEAEFYLEARVQFPGIDGAFGTADILACAGSVIHVVDHKFGSGVRVLALRSDGDTDIVNAQLMFYAAAARHTFPQFFAGVDTITLTILQPQSIEADAAMVSTVDVTHAELDEFITIYRAVCEEALGPAPRLARGSHCRFCPAKPICPAHTAPLLDFARVRRADARHAPTISPALAAGLELLDAVKDLGTALRDQAKQALENGDIVPGFTLTAGRAVRSWHDETSAAVKLIKMGLTRDDVLVDDAALA